MKTMLITGSSGLIGSEVCFFFANRNWAIHGIDNNQRAVFFGPQGDTSWMRRKLNSEIRGIVQHDLDIRDRQRVLSLFEEIRPDAIVHTASQPSHDKAASIPFEDFDINAVGTLNLLEATRRFCAESPFVHMSTNKVYGDNPNKIAMKELETRWDYDDSLYQNGIPEDLSIDQSKHSLFGASKAAADILVQEYGRYFGMLTCCLRGGCLTGPNHAGVELHGFLSYLVKCHLEEREYTVFGYNGKQVRDNIHSLDVARFVDHFIESPRSAEVYNLGGGKGNACSILEAFKMIESISGKPMKYKYDAKHREGDHICYYSDLRKMQSHYPQWGITKLLMDIMTELYQSWQNRKQ